MNGKHKGGLSLKERMRLHQLRRQIESQNKGRKIPRTSPQSIPFVRMFPDGICHVKDHFYTRMVEFYDINYLLLENEDQDAIRLLYRKFLDYFDASIKVQIFLFDRKMEDSGMNPPIMFDVAKDDLDEIRQEQVDFLKMQRAKGNNGIVRSKYVIFGMECDNHTDAVHKLNNVAKDVKQNLKNIGCKVHLLNGEERLEILHQYFHQDTMEPFRFSWEDIYRNGASVRDYIAPASFDFSYKDRFKAGNMCGSSFYVNITCPQFSDEFLKNVLDIEGNISVNIMLNPVNILEARKLLTSKLSDIQANKIDQQRQAASRGYDIDILPPEIVATENGLLNWLADCNSSNRKMVGTTIIITCFGKTEREKELLCQRVKGAIQIADCELTPLHMLQEQGAMASAPIGWDNLKITRSLDTQSVSALVPFCTQELFMTGASIYVGLNKTSNNLIMVDRKRLRNPNGIILGSPGSGKSFSAKMEMMLVYLMTKDDILVCDPENEYGPVVKELGGETVQLSAVSQDYLNPMDIQVDTSGTEQAERKNREAMLAKADFLLTLMDLIAGESKKLEADERGIIDECINQIYKTYFADPRPDKAPILENLYDALRSHENPKAERIANCLYIYVHGSQNYFNHRTSIDFNNRLLCFNIFDLPDNLKELGMLVVQDTVWNRVFANKTKRIATRYYCDEFHQLLRERRTAVYMVEMWKRFRKWGGIPTGITQNVSDFLRSHDVESILGNSDYVLLFNQSAKDQDIVADKFKLSEKQLDHVSNADQGSGLMIFDGIMIPFINHYPTNTRSYEIMSTKPEERIS